MVDVRQEPVTRVEGQTLEVCTLPSTLPSRTFYGGRVVDPVKLFHRRIANRSMTAMCRRLYIGAHTVLCGHQENFADEGPIVEFDQTIDAVLTSVWTSEMDGFPKLSLCFRLYKPEYDAVMNLARYGAANIYTKDGSRVPEADHLFGTVFDISKKKMRKYDRSVNNFLQFLDLDGETEAATRDPSMICERPKLGDVLLAFEPSNFPLPDHYWDQDPQVTEAVQAASLELLQPMSFTPHWACSRGHTIQEIHRDVGNNELLVVFGEDDVLAVPMFATFSPDVKVGNTVPSGIPLAYLNQPRALHTWAEVVSSLGEVNSRKLMDCVFHYAMVEINSLQAFPSRFCTRDMVAKRRKVLRDLRPVMGRIVHDPRHPTTFRIEPTTAAISIWDIGGHPNQDSLTLRGHGYQATFGGIRNDWDWFFHPRSPQEWHQKLEVLHRIRSRRKSYSMDVAS